MLFDEFLPDTSNAPLPTWLALSILLVVGGLFVFTVVASIKVWVESRRFWRELDELESEAQDRAMALGEDQATTSPDDAAYERRVRNALAHGVTVSYEHSDGSSSEVKLDPTSVESIERFLRTIRAEDALRGRQGESAAPAR